MEMPTRFLKSPQARVFGLFRFPFFIFRLQTEVLFFGGLQALREFGLIAGTFFLPLFKPLDSHEAGFIAPQGFFRFVQQAAAGCRVHKACPPVGDAPITQELRQRFPAQGNRLFQTGCFPFLPFLEGKRILMRLGRLLLAGQGRFDGALLFASRFGQLAQLSTGMLYGGQVFDKPLIRRCALQGGKHFREAGSCVGKLCVQGLMGRLRGGKGVFPFGKFPFEGRQGRLFFKNFDIIFPHDADCPQALLTFPLALLQHRPG